MSRRKSNCKGCGKQKRGVCDVHALVDDDYRIRVVKWCELCKANVCNACKYDIGKRAQAALLRLAGKEIV
jgi:hypothetical protein